MKDGYGAIERADVVKEIFFHEQDVNAGVKLNPGDDVEFNIQMKHVSLIFSLITLANSEQNFSSHKNNTSQFLLILVICCLQMKCQKLFMMIGFYFSIFRVVSWLENPSKLSIS